jgi:hypothetical protein
MDIFYNPYDLMQLQIAVVIAGLVSFCVIGFLVADRRNWLGLTLLSWVCLAVFYATQAPSGTPLVQ